MAYTQSNPLNWMALGPDHEYPLIHVLYFTLCLNGTNDIQLSGLSTQNSKYQNYICKF